MTKDVLLREDEQCEVGDWFAIGSVFTPFGVKYEDQLLVGMRQLLCIDVGSHYIMDFVTLTRPPGTVALRDLLFFVTKVMTEKGMPRKGIIILKSVLLSSNELARDTDTEIQGAFLASVHVGFPAMTDLDRETFRERMGIVNLKVGCHGLCRIEADVTNAFCEQRIVGATAAASNN